MSEREKFDAWNTSYIPQFNGELKYCDVDMELFDAWQACAESMQADQDKRFNEFEHDCQLEVEGLNVRIAQLEEALRSLQSVAHNLGITVFTESPSTWLAEHDKEIRDGEREKCAKAIEWIEGSEVHSMQFQGSRADFIRKMK